MNIIQGSILDFEGDAIVNPANSFLRHGAGLAAVIAKAAAPKNAYSNGHVSYHDVCNEIGKTWWAEQIGHPTIPTGGVGVTSAGHLPYKGIIHAVGPVWGGGNYYEVDLLEMVHTCVFETVLKREWKSVALPAISCGLFGYPVEEASGVAIEVASWYGGIDISFYLMEDTHFQAYQSALQDKV